MSANRLAGAPGRAAQRAEREITAFFRSSRQLLRFGDLGGAASAVAVFCPGIPAGAVFLEETDGEIGKNPHQRPERYIADVAFPAVEAVDDRVAHAGLLRETAHVAGLANRPGQSLFCLFVRMHER